MKIDLKQKYYVAGFLFSYDLKRVALIQKTKPAWQAGRHNAVGGKIEEGETYAQKDPKKGFFSLDLRNVLS